MQVFISFESTGWWWWLDWLVLLCIKINFKDKM